MKYQSQIKTKLVLIILGLVVSNGLSAQTADTVNFDITDQCLNYTKLENKSTSDPSKPIIGYLWEITEVGGTEVIQTTTENPILSFNPTGSYSGDNHPKYNFTLTAIANGGHDTFSLTKENIEIYRSPELEIYHWDDLVCSNADSTFYIIQPVTGFSYEWVLSGIPPKYIAGYSGEYTNQLKIAWNKLEDDEGSLQINLACNITSNEATGMCDAVVSSPVILLSSSVPKSENLEVIAKENDPSMLFCIIDNPENYYFIWGYETNDQTIYTEPRTENNYFRWKDGLNESRTYFVEILNKDFTYCTTTVIYDKEKSEAIVPSDVSSLIEVLNLYPNPATDMIHIDLMKKTDKQESVSISVFNFMGQLEKSYRFELTDEISKLSIPVAHLSPGHYFLRFDVLNSRSIVEKFVVINK
jgi:hypothetical protein